MAVRKSKARQWAIKLNDGRFTLPETQVWGIAARGELANIRGKHFSAAYIDCSKCYERVDHNSAATAAVKTGCNSTIVALAFDMYKTPRAGAGAQIQHASHRSQQRYPGWMCFCAALP
eukprot:16002864-Heterocapsa_arctica.AAC.1